ncbi:MAG: hypothetical protein WC399_03805 [Bacilli bacterium]|jgi:hypothetical protein
MHLFDLLKSEQKGPRLSDSEEHQFFLAHRHLLIEKNCFLDLYNPEDSFALVKANIVLRSLINKNAIEEKLQALGQTSVLEEGRLKHHDIRTRMVADGYELPYFLDKDVKMYVPIFNRAMNFIYAREPDRLFDYPYEGLTHEFNSSLINPFEMYNFALFDSNFTCLIKLGSDATSTAFYHIDYREVLIINRQGGLDVRIALFDKNLEYPNYEGVIDRLLPVVAAYFANDRDALVAALLKGQLVSGELLRRWAQSQAAHERRKYRL